MQVIMWRREAIMQQLCRAGHVLQRAVYAPENQSSASDLRNLQWGDSSNFPHADSALHNHWLHLHHLMSTVAVAVSLQTTGNKATFPPVSPSLARWSSTSLRSFLYMKLCNVIKKSFDIYVDLSISSIRQGSCFLIDSLTIVGPYICNSHPHDPPSPALTFLTDMPAKNSCAAPTARMSLPLKPLASVASALRAPFQACRGVWDLHWPDSS